MSLSACLPFISLPSQLLLAFAAPSREWPYGNGRTWQTHKDYNDGKSS